MSSATNQHEPHRIRIAVADDEVELRDYWHEILPRLGYELVGIVSSGDELVELCALITPDVIITDAWFEGLSGVDAVEVIRRDLAVGVVFVTGRLHEDEAAAQRAVGVILAKPFTIDQLRPAVETAWQQVQEHRRVQ